MRSNTIRTKVVLYCYGVCSYSSCCHAWQAAAELTRMPMLQQGLQQNHRATISTWKRSRSFQSSPIFMGGSYRSWGRTAPFGLPKKSMFSTSSSKEKLASQLPSSEEKDLNDKQWPKFRVYYNDVYEVPLPANHRFPMKKYRMVREKIQEIVQQRKERRTESANKHGSPRMLTDIEFIVSPLTTTEELASTHEQRYIQRFLTGEQTQAEQRNVGFPWSPQGVDRALSSVGGTLAAACYVCEQELARQDCEELNSFPPAWAAHVAGGTHHAFSDYGEGFSVFSDIAVAANVALERYPIVLQNNILIIDLDVHQGNGNAVLFRDKPNVFTFSIHCSGNFFSEKQKSDLDIELPIGCNDSTYLMTLHHWLKEFRKQHQNGSLVIDLVIFQAGVDILDSDRLGRMGMSPDGVHRRNELVYQFVHSIKKPLVICMGGGYPKRITGDTKYGDDGWPEIIDAHANVYVQAFDFLSANEKK